MSHLFGGSYDAQRCSGERRLPAVGFMFLWVSGHSKGGHGRTVPRDVMEKRLWCMSAGFLVLFRPHQFRTPGPGGWVFQRLTGEMPEPQLGEAGGEAGSSEDPSKQWRGG